MGIFSKNKKSVESSNPGLPITLQDSAEHMLLANMVLDSISEGVIIVDTQNIVRMINPAALAMVGYSTPDAVMNVNVMGLLSFENGEGIKIDDASNEVFLALNKNQEFMTRSYVLVNVLQQKKAVAVTITLSKTGRGEKIISLRDITKELEEEGEQAEFISTASHEMRTPVASIEGYLGLALNPQCATIDDRARKYLEEAHASSQHLGRLFKDLLDVTKLDDKKAKVHLVPTEVNSLVREIVDGQIPLMGEKNIKFTFGSGTGSDSANSGIRTIDQVSYALVDIDFVREIVNNLVENAIKYTKPGGAIWVNVRGDGDRVLVNVTDTGIGISPDDLKHIFQKFYRVDNSQTREIGGTGLGLYIVKMRAEAMGGKVWAESSFGEGSTFYLSLPRLTFEEYERRKQVLANTEMMSAATPSGVSPTAAPLPTIIEQAGKPKPEPVGQVFPATMQPVPLQQQMQVVPPVQPAAPAQPIQPVQQPVQPQIIQPQPMIQPQPVIQTQPVVQAQPVIQTQPIIQAQPVVQPQIVAQPMPQPVQQTQPTVPPVQPQM